MLASVRRVRGSQIPLLLCHCSLCLSIQGKTRTFPFSVMYFVFLIPQAVSVYVKRQIACVLRAVLALMGISFDFCPNVSANDFMIPLTFQ